jgi:hypothetical protein
MALRGDLKDFALADIFELILQQGKSGRLQLKMRDDTASIVFTGGRIIYAGEDISWLDRMVALNLEIRNKIESEQINQFHDLASKNKLPFFKILLKNDVLGEEEYRQIINNLVEDFICDLFQWNEGNYNFDTDINVEPYKIWNLSFDTQGLIMEGMRRHDEWMVMKNLISSSQAVFRKHKTRSVKSFASRSRTTDSDNLTESEEIWVRMSSAKPCP